MTSLCLVLATVFVGGGSIDGFAQRAFANQEPVSKETITFESGSTSSGTTNITPGYTHYGSTILCKVTGNDTTQSSGIVGAVKEGSEIRFYESDGVTEYLFEDIDRFILNFGTGTSNYTITGFYSTGEPYSFTHSAKVSSERSGSFPENSEAVKVRITFINQIAVKLLKVRLEYNCVSKVQTDVEISTAPTKTSYQAGQFFDPTGMIVKNVYSNGGKTATDDFTYYPTGMLQATDEYVTITSNGFSVQQPITVSESPTGLSGTYTNSSWSLNFTDESHGTYTYGSEVLNFTYTVNGTSVVFTYVSGDNTAFGSNRLFSGGSSPTTNSTCSITSDTQLSLKTYNVFDSAQNRTFTKSA